MGKLAVHPGLSLGNFLITPNFIIKVSDLGLSKEIDEAVSQTGGPGSLMFLAPEARKATRLNSSFTRLGTNQYTKLVDQWSFGILISQIICECCAPSAVEMPPLTIVEAR